MKKLFVTVFVLTVLLAGAGFADVRIEALSRVSMLAGMGDLEVDSKTEYQGDKRYEISNSRFIGGLKKAGVFLNRKMLSELAIADPLAFDKLAEMAKAQMTAAA